MKIIVISLPDSQARRVSSQTQLKGLGLEFQFLDAIDGRNSDHELLARYNESKFIIHYGRPANKGEIGCYASHYLAWEYCVNTNEPILVLEDDFELRDNFVKALSVCEEHIEEAGYIRLQETKRSRASKEKELGEFTLVKYTKAPQGGLCYALTPSVAQRFLYHSREISYPLDVFVRHFWIHKIPLYGLTPYAADGGALSVDSVIGQRCKTKKSRLIQTRRLLHKCNARLRSTLENLRYQCQKYY